VASIFCPLHGWVQRLVDRFSTGGWYDYRLGVNRITQGLELITDLKELGETVSKRLVETMRLEEGGSPFSGCER